MLHNRQSSVVDITLRELWFRNTAGIEKRQEKTVLVLLFNPMNGIDCGLNGLKVLHENKVKVQICPDENILDHYRVNDLAVLAGIDNWITVEDALFQKEKFDYFYIPFLTFSTVSDLLHFNDTRPSIRLLLWALMKGKQVGAVTKDADPYHRSWRESGLDQGTALMKHEMKKQLQQIRGFGIQFIDDANDIRNHFITAFPKNNRKVITADSVISQAKAGQRYMNLAAGTIITPLARDTARKYQITIGEGREQI